MIRLLLAAFLLTITPPSAFSLTEINLLDEKPGFEPADEFIAASSASPEAQNEDMQEVDNPLLSKEEIPEPPPTPNPQKPLVIKLGALDKITGRLSTIEARVDEDAVFERLTITPRFCEKAPPEDPPEVKIFLEIQEKKTTDATEKHLIFSNWMFASAPAACAMEHPIYDIWVIGAEEENQSKS